MVTDCQQLRMCKTPGHICRGMARGGFSSFQPSWWFEPTTRCQITVRR
nr:MAG TPA: hypothetical protein [Caudoviricetes sp.]